MTQPNDLSQVVPAPNWCPTCRRRPNDPMFCSDGFHDRIESPTPAEVRGEVQRWFAPLYGNQPGHAYTSGTGQFVKYDDYATLARKLAEAEERVEAAKADERWQMQRALQAEARLAAVEGLPAKWEQGIGADHRRICANQLRTALQPKE